jgi:hypothetical protein
MRITYNKLISICIILVLGGTITCLILYIKDIKTNKNSKNNQKFKGFLLNTDVENSSLIPIYNILDEMYIYNYTHFHWLIYNHNKDEIKLIVNYAKEKNIDILTNFNLSIIDIINSNYIHMPNRSTNIDYYLSVSKQYNKDLIIWGTDYKNNTPKNVIIQAYLKGASNNFLNKGYKVIISDMDYWSVHSKYNLSDYKYPDNILGAEFTYSTPFVFNLTDILYYVKYAGIKLKELN